MIRKHIALLGVALIAAGCSESATAPFTDGGDIAAVAVHTTIDKPVVGSSVAGADVTISWTWSDVEDNWDLVSFKVTRDGEDIGASIPNAKPYTALATLNRSAQDAGVDEGTYEYCVEVMAKYRSGRGVAEITNHSFECVEVTVGAAEYRIEVVDGNIADGEQNANSDMFTLTYMLYFNNVLVTDCAVAPAVSVDPEAEVEHHNCDGTTGERGLGIRNPDKGTKLTYSMLFKIDEEAIGSFGFNTK